MAKMNQQPEPRPTAALARPQVTREEELASILAALETKFKALLRERKEVADDIVATRGAVIRTVEEQRQLAERRALEERARRRVAVDPETPIAATPVVKDTLDLAIKVALGPGR